MPDIAERSTDIGIAQSTVPAAAATQISAAFLWDIDMISSVFEWLAFQDQERSRLNPLRRLQTAVPRHSGFGGIGTIILRPTI